MNLTNYISLKVVMDDILDHPMMQGVTYERVINYAVHFLRILCVSPIFEDKIEVLKVEDYRALLPCDFYKMNQVRIYKSNRTDNSTPYTKTYRYSTDTFHNSDIHNNNVELTYKIQGNIIYTSNETCDLEISYQAIKVDDEGYPMIPDDSAYINAFEQYVKLQWFTRLFDLGKIQPAVLQNVQQEYDWAVGQAHAHLLMPTVDEMESISNSWNTLLARTNEHRRGFISNGSKELWRVH